MADVINKTTLQYLKSVHTPNYLDAAGNPKSEWLINPILPDCEQKYWRIYNGELKEMTATQKKVVDDAELAQIKEAQKSALIEARTRDLAIASLIDDGVLDIDGNIKE